MRSEFSCHSGLDPESSVFSSKTGCRIKSGMTAKTVPIESGTTRHSVIPAPAAMTAMVVVQA
jgi:hypothetical protein